MADATSFDHIGTATGILNQLLKYTRQLTESENDPGVDITALSKACAQRLEDLKSVLPIAMKEAANAEGAGRPSPEKSDMAGKIRELREQTRLCIEALERGRDITGGKLKVFVNARRVIRAYSA